MSLFKDLFNGPQWGHPTAEDLKNAVRQGAAGGQINSLGPAIYGAAGAVQAPYDPGHRHSVSSVYDDPRSLGFHTEDPTPYLQQIDQQIKALEAQREAFLRGHRDRKLSDYIEAQHPEVASEYKRVCDVQDAIKGEPR